MVAEFFVALDVISPIFLKNKFYEVMRTALFGKDVYRTEWENKMWYKNTG